MRLQKLAKKAGGDCPRCGELAYPWAVGGVPDGYIDACVECAPQIAQDLLDQTEADRKVTREA